MQKSRIKKELSKLKENNYNFSYIENEKNIELSFLTNYGDLIIELPKSYPFSPPKVYIENYKNFDIILPLHKLKLYFKNKLTNDSIEIIFQYLHTINTDKINYKKYLHNLMNYNTNINNVELLWKYDEMLLGGWSPANFIYDVINHLINFNNFFKLKKKHHLKLIDLI